MAASTKRVRDIQRYAIIIEEFFYDSFKNASRDEGNILDQIYVKKMCSEFYYDDF